MYCYHLEPYQQTAVNLISINTFSLNIMPSKLSSAKWWPFCLNFNVNYHAVNIYIAPPSPGISCLANMWVFLMEDLIVITVYTILWKQIDTLTCSSWWPHMRVRHLISQATVQFVLKLVQANNKETLHKGPAIGRMCSCHHIIMYMFYVITHNLCLQLYLTLLDHWQAHCQPYKDQHFFPETFLKFT